MPKLSKWQTMSPAKRRRVMLQATKYPGGTMAKHQACHGCLDGCTRESAVHCTICVNQAWPCDATTRGDLLMDAAASVHHYRKHPPYGSSFIDCDQTPCVRYRAGLGSHLLPDDQKAD